jgi:hypothetical protein
MANLKNDKNDVAELVRKLENDYTTGTTTISKYVEFSQYENIEKIDAYLNSKHISGDKDSLDRDKPFFNIVSAAVNIWYRATDIDRKNIRIKASKLSQYVAAFVATIHLQEWMRRSGFGAFLNDWGRALARYGSSVLKFVEKDGELKASVIPWNRLISDTVDFENNPKIEILWYTPAQLLKNESYDQDLVHKLLDTLESRENLDKSNKDTKAEYIKVYEVHGELPLSYLTGKKKDEDDYVQQMHVISFIARKENGDFDDYTLFKGREARDPYMITHLIKEDGRAQSIGAVEYLFEAQWMKNHTVKAMKDYLDIASKLIMQTSDESFVGQNVLSAIESGDILVHNPQRSPLTVVNTAKPDITQLQAFGQQWEVLAKEIVATPEALTGGKQPSGTAWRTIEAQRQEAHSLFELMTENKGLQIEQMMRKYVIPHIKKKMDTTEELVATLEGQHLSQFDSMYVPNEAIRRENDEIKKTVLSGEIAENLDRTTLENGIRKELANFGTQRFIKPSDIESKTWKQALGDLEWDVTVDVTGEETDKDAVMTTLTTVLQTLATNPMVLQDPNMKLLFNRILEETGAISSLELSQTPAQPQMPVQPQQPATGGGSNAEGLLTPTQPNA